MIKNFEKLREVTVLNFFNLVLKKYGKWYLKMCGNPVKFIIHWTSTCLAIFSYVYVISVVW